MQTHEEETEEWMKLGAEDQGLSFQPLGLSVEQRRRQSRLLDGHWPECVFCKKPIHQIGGQELINTSSIKILVKDQPVRTDSNTHCIEINSAKYAVLKGSKWTAESITRTVEAINSGYQPWFCQVCANKTCKECGSPTQWVQGADLINGNHCAVFPINSGCINPDCENHIVNWKKQVD